MKSNITSSHIGVFLRQARKEKKMTGQQLAKLINISQQQISRYEIGTTPITFDQLQQFLFVLDKRWLDVFKFLENETNPRVKIEKNDRKYTSWENCHPKNL